MRPYAPGVRPSKRYSPPFDVTVRTPAGVCRWTEVTTGLWSFSGTPPPDRVKCRTVPKISPPAAGRDNDARNSASLPVPSHSCVALQRRHPQLARCWGRDRRTPGSAVRTRRRRRRMRRPRTAPRHDPAPCPSTRAARRASPHRAPRRPSEATASNTSGVFQNAWHAGPLCAQVQACATRADPRSTTTTSPSRIPARRMVSTLSLIGIGDRGSGIGDRGSAGPR